MIFFVFSLQFFLDFDFFFTWASAKLASTAMPWKHGDLGLQFVLVILIVLNEIGSTYSLDSILIFFISTAR